MQVGKVKWFDERKGYGFITLKDTPEDIFVHYSAIFTENKGYRTLLPGQEVEFELMTDARGLKAVKVKVIGGTVPVKKES
jgi:CspA family cold shock protein